MERLFRMACRDGNVTFVNALLYWPLLSVDRGLYIACRYGHYHVVKLLLNDPRCDPGSYDNKALFETIERGSTTILELLLDDGRVDPSVNLNNALAFACHVGHGGLVSKILLDDRVDPSRYGNKALILACVGRHVDVVSVLLRDSRVNESSDVRMMLKWSSRRGNVDVARVILNETKVSYHSECMEYCIQIARDEEILRMLRQFHRRKYRGMWKASVWMIVWYRKTMERMYAPGGKISLELKNNFLNIKALDCQLK